MDLYTLYTDDETIYSLTVEGESPTIITEIIDGDKISAEMSGVGGGINSLYDTVIEEEALADGQMTINISTNINKGILFINGLMQRNSAFTISGNTVILPNTLNIISGDIINFYY